MKYYKVLLNNHSCVSSKMDWTKYLPTKNDDGTWTPGKWTRANKKPLELCHNGYHVTDAMHLLDWCHGNQLFEAELGDQVIHGDDKVVTNKMRLLRQVEGWNDKTLRLFACWCVREYCWDKLDDERSKNAVIVSEKYANGEATIEELHAARDAAWNAADAAGMPPGCRQGCRLGCRQVCRLVCRQGCRQVCRQVCRWKKRMRNWLRWSDYRERWRDE